jgi:hypothetical protein
MSDAVAVAALFLVLVQVTRDLSAQAVNDVNKTNRIRVFCIMRYRYLQ